MDFGRNTLQENNYTNFSEGSSCEVPGGSGKCILIKECGVL